MRGRERLEKQLVHFMLLLLIALGKTFDQQVDIQVSKHNKVAAFLSTVFRRALGIKICAFTRRITEIDVFQYRGRGRDAR